MAVPTDRNARYLSRSLGVLLVAAFLLPFVNVSCVTGAAPTEATVTHTGLNLATGTSPITAKGEELSEEPLPAPRGKDPDLYVLGALTLAIAGLVLAFVGRRLALIAKPILALGCGALLVAFRVSLGATQLPDSGIGEYLGTSRYAISYAYGYWLALGLSLLAAGTDLLLLRRRRASSPTPYDAPFVNS